MGPCPNDRGLSRNYILAAIDESLRRLQTDHVDLSQVHVPDFDTPTDETLAALDDRGVAGQGGLRRVFDFPGLSADKSLTDQ